MRISIVGYTGFIGGYLADFYGSRVFKVYNSNNISDVCQVDHDILILAAPSGFKWKVNKDPESDVAMIHSLCGHLKNVSTKHIVYLSTCDVLRKGSGDEDSKDFSDEPYGANRRELESFITSNFSKAHILRLPTVYGLGMKKNIIFDFMTHNKDYIPKINPKNIMQWVNVSYVPDKIKYSIENDINLLHLATEPLDNSEIFKIFNYDCGSFFQGPQVEYNMKTKYSSNGYFQSKLEVIDDIKHFVH